MLQLVFSLLLSLWWFPKYDIITQRLGEGSVILDSLHPSLTCLKKEHFSKILCTGVESRTVIGVYFCHIHQQDVPDSAQNKHSEDQTSHSRFDSNWISVWLKTRMVFLFLSSMDVRVALTPHRGQLHSARQALPGKGFPSGYGRPSTD